MNMARPEVPIAAALRVAPSMSMSPRTTSAPAVAKARAIAFPRPVAEPAVGVRKRMSCGHLLDVPLRVQCIAFLERPPESAGKNGGDRGFTAARPTHGNQDAWFQLGDLKAPSALSARVVIGLEQWHKRYRTAFAR